MDQLQNGHFLLVEMGPCMSHLNIIGFAPSMCNQFHSSYLTHGWHGCKESMQPFQHSLSQCVPQSCFQKTCVFSFWPCACDVLWPFFSTSTLTNQFSNLKALLFPRRTNVSMPNVKLNDVCVSWLECGTCQRPTIHKSTTTCTIPPLGLLGFLVFLP